MIINIWLNSLQLKVLSAKEQYLDVQLTKYMNEHFLRPNAKASEENISDNVYGVCEIVDGCQKVRLFTSF